MKRFLAIAVLFGTLGGCVVAPVAEPVYQGPYYGYVGPAPGFYYYHGYRPWGYHWRNGGYHGYRGYHR